MTKLAYGLAAAASLAANTVPGFCERDHGTSGRRYGCERDAAGLLPI